MLDSSRPVSDTSSSESLPPSREYQRLATLGDQPRSFDSVVKESWYSPLDRALLLPVYPDEVRDARESEAGIGDAAVRREPGRGEELVEPGDPHAAAEAGPRVRVRLLVAGQQAVDRLAVHRWGLNARRNAGDEGLGGELRGLGKRRRGSCDHRLGVVTPAQVLVRVAPPARRAGERDDLRLGRLLDARLLDRHAGRLGRAGGPAGAGTGEGELNAEHQEETADAEGHRTPPRAVAGATLGLVVARLRARLGWCFEHRVRVGDVALQRLGLGGEIGPVVPVVLLGRLLGHDRLVLRVQGDRDPLGGGPVIDPRVTVDFATADRGGEIVARPVELFLARSQLDEIHETHSIGSGIPAQAPANPGVERMGVTGNQRVAPAFQVPVPCCPGPRGPRRGSGVGPRPTSALSCNQFPERLGRPAPAGGPQDPGWVKARDGVGWGAFFGRARWNARCFLPPSDRLVC